MTSPPFDRRGSTACALVLVVTSLCTLTAVETAPSGASTAGPEASCGYDSYTPPSLEFDWEETYTNALDDGSDQDWSGGQIVSVGGKGNCSLLVTRKNSESLEAMSINGTRGVVTGVVDLGANGSVTFSANISGSAASANETSEIVVSNPGPEYGTTVVIEAGSSSETVSLSSGRFFQFALQQDNGTARIAVWDLEGRWDDEWDYTVENVTSHGDWDLSLDGEAFLDGVSVGVAETDGQPTLSETTTPDETADDDDQLGPGNEPDWDDENTDPDDGQESSGGLFGGVLLMVVGTIGFRYARALTRFDEQLDAIGSTTDPSEVEAAGWNVLLTKAVAVFLALFGLYMAGTAVL